MITAYSDLLPYVIPELPGCSLAMASQALQRAGRRFCSDTEVWQKDLAAIDLVASQAQYGLDPAEVTDAADAQPEPEVRSIIWLKISGSVQDVSTYDLVAYTGATPTPPLAKPAFAVQFGTNYIPQTSSTGTLTLRVALSPDWSSTHISSYVLSRHGLAIASGALFDLMTLAGAAFFNGTRAAYHKEVWDSEINSAIKERYTGRKFANLQVSLTPWV